MKQRCCEPPQANVLWYGRMFTGLRSSAVVVVANAEYLL
jgi:hypothetical protein